MLTRPLSSYIEVKKLNVPPCSYRLPLLKGISLGKNHLTCEELEAEIKSSSPIQKKSQGSDSSLTLTTNNSLGTLLFPMSLGSASGVADSATKDHSSINKLNVSLEMDDSR